MHLSPIGSFAFAVMINRWLLVVAVLALPAFAQPQGQNSSNTPIVIPTEPPVRCERIDSEICGHMPWNYTLFPNFRFHATQVDADMELEQFRKLIEVNCSGAIVHFLCAIYTPFCTEDHPLRVLRPCRRLCQHVRDGCEPIFNQQAQGLPWPDHLNCDNYDDSELCFGPGDKLPELTIPPELVLNTTDIPTTSSPSDTTPSSTPTEPSSSPRCPMAMNVSENIQNKGFSFAGIDNCGPNCGGIYFTHSQRNTIAPLFILMFALACIVFTLFTVATFFINRNRFHYPERPIVYLSFSYLILSVAYFVGAISKLAGKGDASFSCTLDYNPTPNDRSSSFVFQSLPNDNVNMSTTACVILFLLAYYSQMAASLWWVILTFTWFLAAVLKWGEEAVERLWLLYHIIAWSIPALQVIFVLALQMVDGDQLSGLCYPGQFSSVALGVFVFMPLFIYLVVGCVFFFIGFSALINIRRELERDPVKSRKLGRLIIRIAVYASLYIIPSVVLLIIHIYELAERQKWEENYIDHESCRGEGNNSKCPSSPSFAAYVIRYIALFCIGISSTLWIFSKKTFNTWTKFFHSCGCGPKKMAYKDAQAYGLSEKDPRQLQTAV